MYHGYLYATNGWQDSDIREELNSTIFNTLDKELQDVIKPTKKVSIMGNKTKGVVETEDKLWLLSVKEIGRHTNFSESYEYYNEINSEGETYEYFTQHFQNLSKIGSTYLRTTNPTTNRDYYYVTSGSLYSNNSNYSVIPAFVIG